MKKFTFVLFPIFYIIFLLASCTKPDFSQYDHLLEPQITTKEKQKMIVVELKGDPNIAAKTAFSVLFKTFYELKKTTDDIKIGLPRTRYTTPFTPPIDEWIGIYGLPIPENVETLPEKNDESDPDVRIEYWEYGEIAEILHIGPYKDEGSSVMKLHKFVNSKGYKITGVHEEEYLKGPGIFFKGNEKRYKTIIRYNIAKK